MTPCEAISICSPTGQLVKEVLLDGNFVRFALVAVTPFGYLLAIVSLHGLNEADDSSLPSVSVVIFGKSLDPSPIFTRTRTTTLELHLFE